MKEVAVAIFVLFALTSILFYTISQIDFRSEIVSAGKEIKSIIKEINEEDNVQSNK